MYNIPYFKEQDQEVVLDFMKAHPFAMLIGSANDVPVATQVPVLIEERDGKLYLLGHIMRNTDHHRALARNSHALCVFTGAHSYVSASWYTNKEQASTWNYLSVHARGTLSFLDETTLLDILRRTTDHFENNPASPAAFDKLPADYVQRLAKAIVAFEIEVTTLEHVFKLSQNRDRESYRNIVAQLEHNNPQAQQIAKEMTKRASQLFNQSSHETGSTTA